MIDIKVDVENLEELQGALSKSPKTIGRWLNKALRASIFEVEKQAKDSNFKFKTPRSKRTGQLQISFKQGIKYYPSGLKASIGPTVKYAPYVYYGTRRGISANPYMDRIAKASESRVQKHFKDAIDRAVEEIAV